MVFTPLAFAFDLPALLPIGCGLLSSPVSALPAGGGVIIYYFVRYVRVQSQALMSAGYADDRQTDTSFRWHYEEW